MVAAVINEQCKCLRSIEYIAMKIQLTCIIKTKQIYM